MSEKRVIATFDTLSEAKGAVMVLDRKGWPMAQISLFATELQDENDLESAEQFVVAFDGKEEEAEKAKTLLQDTGPQQASVRQPEAERT